LKKIVLDNGNSRITPKIVSGTVNHESMWDAGAVGYLDDSDLGLAQINGTAHPDLSRVERLNPLVAFDFVVRYYENALSQLDNNVRDAIASYNLGIGGARRWISQGRPQWYTPEGASRARNVWQYIDSILAG
jgi:soluble lytic murein transglycosylase-like protein